MGGWLGLGLAALGVARQWRGLRAYRALPALPAGATGRVTPAPRVSIVVPARNEAANLARLLPDLLAQDYPDFDVTVVDDESTDATAAVARRHGVGLVAVPPLPPGWAGKPHACQVGAHATSGEWLLFVDADTRHDPSLLTRAMAAAREGELDVVSLLADQECVTFWERLVLPFAYASYFAAVDPTALNRAPSEALINGQYLLVRRTMYGRAGGHAAVRASIVEDVALAVTLVRSRARMGLFRAPGLLRVRMYGGRVSVFEGFAKNSFAFTRLQPRRGAVVAGVTAATSLVGPTTLASIGGSWTRRLAAVGVAGVAAYVAGSWAAAFGVPRRFGLLQPVAAMALLAIALRSTLGALGAWPVTWKGRRYRP